MGRGLRVSCRVAKERQAKLLRDRLQRGRGGDGQVQPERIQRQCLQIEQVCHDDLVELLQRHQADAVDQKREDPIGCGFWIAGSMAATRSRGTKVYDSTTWTKASVIRLTSKARASCNHATDGKTTVIAASCPPTLMIASGP